MLRLRLEERTNIDIRKMVQCSDCGAERRRFARADRTGRDERIVRQDNKL